MDIVITNDQTKVKIEEQLYEVMEQVGILTLTTAGGRANYEVSVLLTDNEEIKTMNKKYRKVDQVTDVLSFPLLESDGDEEPLFFSETEEIILGDVVISAEKAKEQSEDFGHSFTREITYLLVHGILHLLGYDHDNQENKKEMRKKEEEALLKMSIVRE